MSVKRGWSRAVLCVCMCVCVHVCPRTWSGAPVLHLQILTPLPCKLENVCKANGVRLDAAFLISAQLEELDPVVLPSEVYAQS